MACRCVVRGSINIDDFFYVHTIARPGETISSREYKRRIGGKGANQAVAIARAGGNVAFYGTIGRDGEWLIAQMKVHINIDGIVTSNEATGRALIQVADNGENSIVLFPGANYSQLHEEHITEVDGYYCTDATHVLLQNEIHIQSTLHALEHAHDAITIINPSPLPSPAQVRSFPWHRVDWLIVNRGEAEGLYQSATGQETCVWSSEEELLQLLLTSPLFTGKIPNIICTLGARGVLAVMPPAHEGIAASFIRVPAAGLRCDVLDTTGAGDCFTGYFVQELMGHGPGARLGNGISEKDVENMVKVAAQAAGISVERLGSIDSIPSAQEVKERMRYIG